MSRPLRLVFAGTPEFAVPSLEALVAAGHRVVAAYTQPDRPAGRGRALLAPPVKQRALALGIPVAQPASLASVAERSRLAALEPDALIVVAYGLLLGPRLLAVPRLGGINVHASLLPRWRGAAPIQRAIEAGDRETGVCIMHMDQGLDTGPVFARRSVEIGAHETAAQLHDRLAVLGAELLVQALPAIAAGALAAEPQAAAGACYARKLAKGEALLAWDQDAEALERKVRALLPWPVAETRWHEQPLRVHAARALVAPAPGAAPGTVLRAGADGVVVACGRGALALTSLQLPGGKPLTAAQFVAARALVGERLG
jgi:methionyl-tRNA formyltransferase